MTLIKSTCYDGLEEDGSELLNVRPGEVRALLLGQLPEERAEELKQQLLRTGIPL
jgi:hypothetical protein